MIKDIPLTKARAQYLKNCTWRVVYMIGLGASKELVEVEIPAAEHGREILIGGAMTRADRIALTKWADNIPRYRYTYCHDASDLDEGPMRHVH